MITTGSAILEMEWNGMFTTLSTILEMGGMSWLLQGLQF